MQYGAFTGGLDSRFGGFGAYPGFGLPFFGPGRFAFSSFGSPFFGLGRFTFPGFGFAPFGGLGSPWPFSIFF